ncbi:MAG: type II toxin-antitoxin system Phd/YefM family antitoxin [Fimbriimonadaceae bacterium]
MREIGAFEAKTHFSALLVAVEAGESITITRRGKPVAMLTPIGHGSPDDRARVVADIKEARKAYRLEGLDWRTLRDEGRR